MTTRRVAVLGGGPAGLYSARLLKLHRPSLEVTVYERNDPGETFGFGVAFTGATQRNLVSADEASYRALVRAGREISSPTFRLPGSQTTIASPASLSIGRSALLRALLGYAESAGVRFEIGSFAFDEVDADVVLACDGANSATRAALAGELGARVDAGRAPFLWCGTDFALPWLFVPVTTEHGTFVAHTYSYAEDRSTVVIETDEATWRAAGLDRAAEAMGDAPPGASDEVSLAYLEEAFGELLHGHPLLGNRTRWLRFNTVTCERWHHGRTVLLGDAAHTAHPSVGSGTKLAMEDAIALSACLVDADDPEVAFSAYTAQRRPAVARIQQLARQSQLWWESFPRRLGLPAPQIAVGFMTRAGNVSLEQLQGTNPELVEAVLSDPAPAPGADRYDPAGRALELPLRWRDRSFPSRMVPEILPAGVREVPPDSDAVWAARADGPDDVIVAVLTVSVADPWAAEGDAVLGTARELLAAGADGFHLTDGCGDRRVLLDRLALAERIRLETGALLIVDGSEALRGDLAAAVACGRTDLVALTPVPAGPGDDVVDLTATIPLAPTRRS